MPYGFECKDAAGNSIVKVTDRLTRVLFTKEVAAGVSGNQNLTMPPGTSIVVGSPIDVGNKNATTGNQWLLAANQLLGIEVNPISSGYLDSITFLGGIYINPVLVRGIVFDADTTAVLSVTDVYSIDSNGWYVLDFIDKPYLNSGTRYFLAVIFDDDGVIDYSANTQDFCYDLDNFFPSPIDLYDWGIIDTDPPCIFGTYTDQFYSGDISKIFGYSYPIEATSGGMSHSVVITTINSTTYNVAWEYNSMVFGGDTYMPSVDSLIVVMGY